MGLLWSLIIGGVAGWLAGRIMKGEGYGVILNILLGIVGGLVGGWVFSLLGLATTSMIGQLICATVGAVLLIVLVRALRK
ncbi:MAG: GlsB/YeaQ/YmgE family stress response membrane protein [Flavobacteriales bacterium]|nr:GlsB/YeaQ/YmgE family stress response membrane protein [Flavobacteriales bacterium]MCL4282880.1 GlsB/YeaQ/YmgE family stress response membrane protein [Flavobacteriales bacterium]